LGPLPCAGEVQAHYTRCARLSSIRNVVCLINMLSDLLPVEIDLGGRGLRVAGILLFLGALPSAACGHLMRFRRGLCWANLLPAFGCGLALVCRDGAFWVICRNPRHAAGFVLRCFIWVAAVGHIRSYSSALMIRAGPAGHGQIRSGWTCTHRRNACHSGSRPSFINAR